MEQAVKADGIPEVSADKKGSFIGYSIVQDILRGYRFGVKICGSTPI